MITYKILNYKIRNRILERDKHKCAYGVYCIEKNPRLQIHHKNGNREDNTDRNLITVCRKCHAYLDKKLRIKRGLIRTRNRETVIKCNFCNKEFLFMSHKGKKYCSKTCYWSHKNQISKLNEPDKRKRQREYSSWFIKNKYANNPMFREKVKENTKKFNLLYKQKRLNNPELTEKYLKDNRERVRKHREKMKEKSKLYVY